MSTVSVAWRLRMERLVDVALLLKRAVSQDVSQSPTQLVWHPLPWWRETSPRSCFHDLQLLVHSDSLSLQVNRTSRSRGFLTSLSESLLWLPAGSTHPGVSQGLTIHHKHLQLHSSHLSTLSNLGKFLFPRCFSVFHWQHVSSQHKTNIEWGWNNISMSYRHIFNLSTDTHIVETLH